MFESVDIVAGWDEVRKATEWVLEPIISAWRSFLGKGGSKEKKIVLLVDEALASLPIEALEFLNDAESISRDFSLHMLSNRLARGSDITAAHMTALIDLRKEDLPQSDADKIRIPGEFALLQQKFGSGWNVLMGTPESIPGEAECQRAMAAAKALLYYGHGRFCHTCRPRQLPVLTCPVADLLYWHAHTNNEESQRMQAMLDGRKTAEKKALEEPYRTAALLSMRGVESIVLPSFTVGNARANSEFLTSRVGRRVPWRALFGGADTPKPPRKEDEIEENEPEEKEVEEPEEGANAEGEDEAGDDEAEAVEPPPPPPPPPPPSGPYRTYVVYGHPLVKIS